MLSSLQDTKVKESETGDEGDSSGGVPTCFI